MSSPYDASVDRRKSPPLGDYVVSLQRENAALRARVAALRAEAVGLREALEAVRSCPGYFYPDTGVEGVYAEVVTCEECGGGSNGCESYIAAQALASSPLTAAAAERWAAMERVCEVTKRTINCDKWGTAECSYDCQGKNWDVCEALVALAALKEAPDA